MIKIKKEAVLFILLILLGANPALSLFALEAKEFTVTGEQIVSTGNKNEMSLFCPLIVIPQGKVGVITNIVCDGLSFWITDKSKQQTIASFKDPNKAVGYQLKSGSYYAYPSLQYNQLGRPLAKAKVTLTVTLK